MSENEVTTEEDVRDAVARLRAALDMFNGQIDTNLSVRILEAAQDVDQTVERYLAGRKCHQR
jgi:hypothetical protein